MTPPAYVPAAIALRRSHPAAPARDVLDLVMRGRAAGPLDEEATWLQPAAPFGALLIEAFDVVMPPAEWAGLMGPRADPGVVAKVRGLWLGIVIDGFMHRYPQQS